MRGARLVIVIVALLAAGIGAHPAGATHCSPQDPASCPTPASVWLLEGIGFVCNEAKGFTNPRCTYHVDELTPQLPPTINQGLYWPGVGPGARGPFSFKAGPDLNIPASLCVASVDGIGCTFDARGSLQQGRIGSQATVGAYCGSSRGSGTTTFRSAGNSLVITSTLGWEQSAATILPLQGTVTAPPRMVGATLTGFTSSRGVSGGGNCGITQATTQFQVEGVVIVF